MSEEIISSLGDSPKGFYLCRQRQFSKALFSLEESRWDGEPKRLVVQLIAITR